MLLSLLSSLLGRVIGGTPTPVTATIALETYHQLDLSPIARQLDLSPYAKALDLNLRVHEYDLSPSVKELF